MGAFVIRPDNNTCIRLAAGTSTTFPFVGQVSGLATYEPPACSLGAPYADGGTLTEKNPNLNPETSIAYDVGADHRFSNNSVISADLQETIVHGVFEQLTSIGALGAEPNLCLAPQPSLEGIFFPANVAKLDVKSVTLKYAYAPMKGFGFNLSASAQSAILSGPRLRPRRRCRATTSSSAVPGRRLARRPAFRTCKGTGSSRGRSRTARSSAWACSTSARTTPTSRHRSRRSIWSRGAPVHEEPPGAVVRAEPSSTPTTTARTCRSRTLSARHSWPTPWSAVRFIYRRTRPPRSRRRRGTSASR